MSNLKYFLIILMVFACVGCRSQQMNERIANLQATIEKLNESETYWGDATIDEIVETRSEVVQLLIEEGAHQKRLALENQDNKAKYLAGMYYTAVLRLAGRNFTVVDVELSQTWLASSEIYYSMSQGGEYPLGILWWNLFPITAPFIWIGEIGSFVIDMIGGWSNVFETRNVPSLADIFVLQAETSLAELEQVGLRLDLRGLGPQPRAQQNKK